MPFYAEFGINCEVATETKQMELKVQWQPQNSTSERGNTSICLGSLRNKCHNWLRWAGDSFGTGSRRRWGETSDHTTGQTPVRGDRKEGESGGKVSDCSMVARRFSQEDGTFSRQVEGSQVLPTLCSVFGSSRRDHRDSMAVGPEGKQPCSQPLQSTHCTAQLHSSGRSSSMAPGGLFSWQEGNLEKEV